MNAAAAFSTTKIKSFLYIYSRNAQTTTTSDLSVFLCYVILSQWLSKTVVQRFAGTFNNILFYRRYCHTAEREKLVSDFLRHENVTFSPVYDGLCSILHHMSYRQGKKQITLPHIFIRVVLVSNTKILFNIMLCIVKYIRLTSLVVDVLCIRLPGLM